MKIVAVKERSQGNAEVGDMWVDTAIFDPRTPLLEVLKWADHVSSSDSLRRAAKYGRLMLTVADEPEEKP